LRTKTLGRKEPSQMMIIGCDYHPSWQQIAWFDSETGEVGEERLAHASGDAQRFYEKSAVPVLIGMEATGNSQWFIELVQDLKRACKCVEQAFSEAFVVREFRRDRKEYRQHRVLWARADGEVFQQETAFPHAPIGGWPRLKSRLPFEGAPR
jgi:hypothetical protein